MYIIHPQLTLRLQVHAPRRVSIVDLSDTGDSPARLPSGHPISANLLSESAIKGKEKKEG